MLLLVALPSHKMGGVLWLVKSGEVKGEVQCRQHKPPDLLLVSEPLLSHAWMRSPLLLTSVAVPG